MKVNGTGPSTTRGVGGASGAAGVSESQDKKKSKTSSAPGAASAENVSISSRAKEAATAKRIASEAPDVNEDKVARLKAAIENGSYKVDADKIADKLVDEHLRTTY